MVGDGFGMQFSLPFIVPESGPTIHSMYLEHLFESTSLKTPLGRKFLWPNTFKK